MFIFNWFNIFASDYRNGFCDGFILGLVCFGAKCLYAYYKAKHDRKLCDSLHERGDFYWNAQDKPHCPYCYLQGKAVMLAEIREDYFCPTCNRTQSKEPSIRAKFRMYKNPSRSI